MRVATAILCLSVLAAQRRPPTGRSGWGRHTTMFGRKGIVEDCLPAARKSLGEPVAGGFAGPAVTTAKCTSSTT